MKKFLYAVLGLGVLTGVSACTPTGTFKNAAAEPKGGFAQLKESPEKGEEIAVVTTSLGVIKLRFFPEYAPKAVENFVTHAKDGYYNGVVFHRVIDGFMIQSGDPEGTGAGGESIWGEDFAVEDTPQLHNIRGALSMANTGAPVSNGSQFFIVQNDDIDKGQRSWLEHMKDKPDSVYRNAQGQMKKNDDGHYYANKDMYPVPFVDRYLEAGGSPFLDFSYTVFGQAFEGLDVVDRIAALDDGFEAPTETVTIESIVIEKY